MKNPLTSKTIWMGAMTTALGVLVYLEQVPEIPRWALIVIGALIVGLRILTTQPVSIGPKRDKKGRFTAGSCIFLVLFLAGCSTLSVSAKKSADCKFKVQAPHSIICTVDGKQVYEQNGPMALDIKGCCKCQEN
tara:strand:+ start:286 stop:687 length:402 start_codon:yes stop_codon:yes gene_type:complete